MHLSRLIHAFSDLHECVCVLFRKGWYTENCGVETPFCAPPSVKTHTTNIQSLGETLAKPSE